MTASPSAQPPRSRIAHASHHDPRSVFTPRHAHCFPEKPREAARNGEAADPRRDFPETGTPNVLRNAHDQEDACERSERIAASGRIVPDEDDSEWLDPERQED